MSIDVTNKVRAYEANGAECKTVDRPSIEVRSHWNRRNMVVIDWPDGSKMTFRADDLHAAINNATNSSRP